MMGRSGYAGAVGMLLTLACGPQVEIGHGDEDGGSSGKNAGGTAGTVSSAGTGAEAAGETSVGGEPNEPTGGTSQTGGGSASTSAGAGKPGVGGPIPTDNGAQAETGKVDLLLAIDNSISMTEKQQLFAKTIPELLTRLLSPHCVTAAGAITAEPTSPTAACPAGSQREFEPLRDLHVGVITSSLGSHGASGAKDVCVTAGDDDHAHLIARVRPDVDSYDSRGYLKWDPDGLATPPGESDVTAFASSLATMIESSGENGCGYEAQLESVYRFLVDPSPLKSVAVSPNGLAEPVGVDQELLDERAAFLRPDSSVVVLMLTDENDCSIQDEGYGWLTARAAPMYRATSACQGDPNNPCCQSCAETSTNAGCPPIAADSECVKGNTLPAAADDLNLRCLKQDERFGFSLLYSTERYVSGFGDGTVPNRQGQLVPNPLFHRDGVDRDRSLFTLAVIGGVPWQDIATTSSLTGDTLEYMTAEELTSKGRWPVILGNLEGNVEPSDPFMRESTDERSGKNPITGESIVPSTSLNPQANSINGHEQSNHGNRDLQYACTFALPEPVVCDEARMQSNKGCDCFPDDSLYNRSLCNPPGGGAAGITQYFGKGYPALRELAVAKELGRRSVLGSICARNTQDETRSDYGYRPVFGAIGRRVAATLVKP
jgi:hypothetical protein